ncbi:MAG TPA: alpha/beta hydrolase [Casimicrobiaceae bacterium]|nr:alpha/beta hydrolase [Casimicrobiaceae bacterium]
MKIAYRREGRGAPVLLIHGVGGDSGNWGPIAARLQRRFDVIAMDLRGHGRSDLITGPVQAHDLARDAAQVLDECGVAASAVVGFSLGGTVAQALALDFPGRVARLAVMGSPCGRTPEERARALERIEFLKAHGAPALAEANRERWFTDEFRGAHPDAVERRVDQVKACDPASYLYAFTVFCTADFADRLPEIRVATLVVTGEHDVAATPRMARLMGERIGASQVRVLPRLRHSLLIEAPAQVGELLEGFLGNH